MRAFARAPHQAATCDRKRGSTTRHGMRTSIAENHKYEREADCAACDVVRNPTSGTMVPGMKVSGRDPGRSSSSERLNVSRVNPAETTYVHVPGIVHDVVTSSGQTLDAMIVATMEERFGCDFRHVRVHADARAAEAAEVLQASAFTVGHHVVFGHGEYATASTRGWQLIAHELAHVVQQGGATVSGLNDSPALTTIQRQARPSRQRPTEPQSLEELLRQVERNLALAHERAADQSLSAVDRESIQNAAADARRSLQRLRAANQATGGGSRSNAAGVGPWPAVGIGSAGAATSAGESAVMTGAAAGAAFGLFLLAALTVLTPMLDSESWAAEEWNRSYRRLLEANDQLAGILRQQQPTPATRAPNPPAPPLPVSTPADATPAPITTATPTPMPLGGTSVAVPVPIAHARLRPRAGRCRPPSLSGYPTAVHEMCRRQIPLNVDRFFRRLSSLPQTWDEVNYSRQMCVTAIRRETMQNMMGAYSCEGALVAFSRGNKNLGDSEHAEEVAAMALQYQLAAVPATQRAFGTLASCCQVPPCHGNRPPHNCRLLLHSMRVLFLPGGAFAPLVADWPAGFDELVLVNFNEQWSERRGSGMPTPWRAHDAARYRRVERARRGL